MIKVLLESPFKGRGRSWIERFADAETNRRYARAAMRDCLLRGEAPFASHLLYTQDGVLDDDVEKERALGIEAGLIWGACAEFTVVYTDRGITEGMRMGIDRANAEGRTVVMRTIPDWSED